MLNLCDVLIVQSINERACYGKAIADDLKDKINYLIDDCELRNEIINNGLKKSPQYSNNIKLKYNFEVYKAALKG